MIARALLASAALAGLAACGDDGGLPDARPIDARPTPGQLSARWSIAHMGTPLTCSQIAVSQVLLEIVRVGEPFGSVDAFQCASGEGTTGDLAPGRYNVRASLGGGGTLDAPPPILDVEVRPGEITPLPAIAFEVEPTGALAFHVTSPPTGGNCATTAMMGAGITAMSIELRDAAGTCVPTTFAIAAGATGLARTYQSDCANAVTTCIDADQLVRADGVAAGQHSMVIRGRIGTSACWHRTSSFVTRAGGQVTTLSPQALAYDPLVPGCPMMMP